MDAERLLNDMKGSNFSGSQMTMTSVFRDFLEELNTLGKFPLSFSFQFVSWGDVVAKEKNYSN